MSDHTLTLDPRLPDALGAICVHAGRFGTRSSSLLFLDAARPLATLVRVRGAAVLYSARTEPAPAAVDGSAAPDRATRP